MTVDTTRREALLFVASAARAALGFGGAREAYGQSERPASPTPKGQMTMTDHDMHACIDECDKCHRIRVETAGYCLEKGGRHAAPEHIRLLIDCAEICQTSANFMLRGSAVHETIRGACAEVRDRCAESCDRIGDDEQVKKCSQAIRACADSCRNMAKG